MSNEIDPEKLEERLRLTQEAVAVLNQILALQGEQIANLQDWVRRLEDKVRIGF